ncbi:hypothetical protein [Ponticaulis profundi]|uniref:Phenylalanyl-tRNA synthetase subunit beta n=1 Tax=Ponticaulis profundi TaxID=2665222 RepID=A0ABW1SCZ5_9PROT|tara:strand:- start:266 stop:469 length:204 start_codon:yes stop_codon:yes gene_type:complete
MRKYFFWFGVANIVLGLILALYMLLNIEAFGSLENADTSKIEVFFIAFAPIFTGIALMISGWPQKNR